MRIMNGLDTDEEFFDVLDEGDQEQNAKRSVVAMTLPEISTSGNLFDQDHLEKVGRCLQAIPTDDILALRQTSEYRDFLRAFDRMGQAHRRVVAMSRSAMEVEEDGDGNNSNDPESRARTKMMAHFSFLQHLAVDDVVLRVFEFLECHALVRTSLTCSRFQGLAQTSARQRTTQIALSRQLNSVMKLLRAKEQIDGVGGTRHSDCHVSVPLLGMRQRIIVTEAGDPEYNGVYFCTGSNGNGFVFTKPRNDLSRATVHSLPGQRSPGTQNGIEADLTFPRNIDPTAREQDRTLNWDEAVEPGKLLRCIIAKRFSNETILWYMSKEVESHSADANNPGASAPQVTQVFSYWAKLMVVGEAPPDICCCPSLTSVLARNGDPAWQPLSSTRLTHPPTVEILMD